MNDIERANKQAIRDYIKENNLSYYDILSLQYDELYRDIDKILFINDLYINQKSIFTGEIIE